MKVEITSKYEFEIPKGEYCQKADGTINCRQYGYDIDPFRGTLFFCNLFKHYFDVPFDGKRICDKRDIKKCEECMQYNSVIKAEVIEK